MNPRRLHRAWPALATMALLALSAAAPAPLRTGPAPPSQATATCDPFSQSGAGASTYTFDAGSGLRQPLPVGMPIAACSLRANATGWNNANIRIVEWNPLVLAPDPQATALRTLFCNPSTMNYYTTNSLPRMDLVPPLITRSLPGVADPPSEHTAIEVTEAQYANSQSFVGYYAPEGDLTMPAAVTFGATLPLAGTHPVAAHALCDGSGTLEELRVVQSVKRTDSLAPAGLGEYVQRFRVPEAVEVRWVELAIQEADQYSFTPTTVSIVEADGYAEPPVTMPPALAEASLLHYFHYEPGPRWAAPVDFDQSVQLQPGRDYWISLRTAVAHKYRTHTLTASESAMFGYAIGEFHHREQSTHPWTLASGQALSFKLIGRSLDSPLSVPRARGSCSP